MLAKWPPERPSRLLRLAFKLSQCCPNTSCPVRYNVRQNMLSPQHMHSGHVGTRMSQEELLGG